MVDQICFLFLTKLRNNNSSEELLLLSAWNISNDFGTNKIAMNKNLKTGHLRPTILFKV